jgi:MraZ protein
MFFGEYQYKLDDKGRVSIPPRFRRELRDGVVLTPGVEKCIIGYPVSEWRKLASTLTNGAVAPGKLRRLNRAIFATAFGTSVDGQGRIALAPPLREYAEIVSDITIVGANTYFEIWNDVHWGEEKTTFLEQAGQIIESLPRQ